MRSDVNVQKDILIKNWRFGEKFFRAIFLPGGKEGKRHLSLEHSGGTSPRSSNTRRSTHCKRTCRGSSGGVGAIKRVRGNLSAAHYRQLMIPDMGRLLTSDTNNILYFCPGKSTHSAGPLTCIILPDEVNFLDSGITRTTPALRIS